MCLPSAASSTLRRRAVKRSSRPSVIQAENAVRGPKTFSRGRAAWACSDTSERAQGARRRRGPPRSFVAWEAHGRKPWWSPRAVPTPMLVVVDSGSSMVASPAGMAMGSLEARRCPRRTTAMEPTRATSTSAPTMIRRAARKSSAVNGCRGRWMEMPRGCRGGPRCRRGWQECPVKRGLIADIPWARGESVWQATGRSFGWGRGLGEALFQLRGSRCGLRRSRRGGRSCNVVSTCERLRCRLRNRRRGHHVRRERRGVRRVRYPLRGKRQDGTGRQPRRGWLGCKLGKDGFGELNPTFRHRDGHRVLGYGCRWAVGLGRARDTRRRGCPQRILIRAHGIPPQPTRPAV